MSVIKNCLIPSVILEVTTSFALAEAMERSKKNSRQPTLIVAHTIKGWSLKWLLPKAIIPAFRLLMK